jgi:hypothetical protein
VPGLRGQRRRRPGRGRPAGHQGRPALVSLHPRRLGDILDDIARVADAVGRPAAGRRLVAALRDRIQQG